MATVTLYPTTHTAVSGTGWVTNPQNAYSASDSNAVALTASLAKSSAASGDFGGFNLSSLPASYVVNSVTIQVRWRHTGSSTGATLGAQCVSGGATVDTELTRALVTTLTADSAAKTVTKAQLNNAFAVRVRASRATSNTATQGELEYVRIVVDYTATEDRTGTATATTGHPAIGTATPANPGRQVSAGVAATSAHANTGATASGGSRTVTASAASTTAHPAIGTATGSDTTPRRTGTANNTVAHPALGASAGTRAASADAGAAAAHASITATSGQRAIDAAAAATVAHPVIGDITGEAWQEPVNWDRSGTATDTVAHAVVEAGAAQRRAAGGALATSAAPTAGDAAGTRHGAASAVDVLARGAMPAPTGERRVSAAASDTVAHAAIGTASGTAAQPTEHSGAALEVVAHPAIGAAAGHSGKSAIASPVAAHPAISAASGSSARHAGATAIASHGALQAAGTASRAGEATPTLARALIGEATGTGARPNERSGAATALSARGVLAQPAGARAVEAAAAVLLAHARIDAADGYSVDTGRAVDLLLDVDCDLPLAVSTPSVSVDFTCDLPLSVTTALEGT